MKIGIIGTGAFSTSVALSLALKEENEIVMWSENKKLVSDYKKTQKIETLYKDRMFPKNIVLTNSYEEAVHSAQVVFLMTGVSYLEKVCTEIKGFLDSNIPLVIGTKGMAETNPKLVVDLVKKQVKNPISVLGGPTFSIDVANFEPVGFQLACKSKKHFKMIQELFDTTKVKLISSYDVQGVALCGCLKNVYAVGAGILDGLGYHESTHALYLTSVFRELESILSRFDGDFTTLTGLSGFGDLVLTCSSKTSRNFTYGTFLGKKDQNKGKSYLKDATVEGVSTMRAILPVLQKERIKTPLLSCIQAIVENQEQPEMLVKEIMKEKKISLFQF